MDSFSTSGALVIDASAYDQQAGAAAGADLAGLSPTPLTPSAGESSMGALLLPFAAAISAPRAAAGSTRLFMRGRFAARTRGCPKPTPAGPRRLWSPHR